MSEEKENEEVLQTSEEESSENISSEPAVEQTANSEEAVNDSGADEEKAKLLNELEEAKQSLLRERAEFSNYRKRTQGEKDGIRSQATVQLLSDLLPVFDSFEQLASSHDSSGDEKLKPFIDGVALIQKQMWSVFSEKGVQEVHPLGEEFDPNKMEALSVQESEDVDKESVTQVFQKGYLLGDKVIRPARVMLARPAAKSDEK